MIGAGQTGIFSNLSARPDNAAPENRTDNSDYVPEIEQKEGPPVRDDLMTPTRATFHTEDRTVISNGHARCCAYILGHNCRAALFYFTFRPPFFINKR